MTSGILDHLWQSTLFALFAALAAWWLRGGRAEIRYLVWLTVSVKFALPAALLMALGEQLHIPIPLPATPVVILRPSAALGHTQLLTAADRIGFDWRFAAVWILGCTLVFGCRLARLAEFRKLLRNAFHLGFRGGVEVVTVQGIAGPGSWGIWKPVIVLPDGLATRLNNTELETVLLHELTHVRRRDNLASAFQRLLETVFWFHPVVWWTGSRMTVEREYACDEAVLESSRQPLAYAETIMKVCRFSTGHCVAAGPGATGSDLKRRLERIMSSNIQMKPLAAHWLIVAALAGAIVLVPLGLRGRAESQTAEGVKIWFVTEDGKTVGEPDGELAQLRLDLLSGRQQAGLTSKEELQQRISFADQRFKEPGVAGSETARGRIYVQIGPPSQITSNPNGHREIWCYYRINNRPQKLCIQFQTK